MTPLEMLDAAIAAGDLEAITEARRLMTTKKAAVAASAEEEVVDDDGDIPEDTGEGGNSRVECVKRPLSTTPRKNKYKDKGEPFNYTEADKKLLEDVSKQKREERHEQRPPHKKVKATCRDCRKTYMVDPSMHVVNTSVEGNKISFLCSSCLNSKGR